MRKKNCVAALLLLLLGCALFAAGFFAGKHEAVNGNAVAAGGAASVVTKDVLFEASHSWDGKPYGAYPEGKADIQIVKIVIPPNTRLASHTHPMPNVAYVFRGALTVQNEADHSERHLKPGDFLAEMVGTPHYGYTGPEGVELYVVYCGVTGQSLSESAK